MHCKLLVFTLVSAFATQSLAQVENPDFRIRAKFRDSSDTSVGNATFLVKSRFMQVYYGGVNRQDDYRFKINLASSAFANLNFDVFLDDFFVGTHAADVAGIVDVTYRSDFKPADAPDLPLPADFPDPVDVGNIVNIFDTLTGNLLLSSTLEEEFFRGDADHDRDVDRDDLAVLEANYGQIGIGPAFGDFDGDNDSDGNDLLIWQSNYSGPRNGSGGAISTTVPEPSSMLLFALMTLGSTALLRVKRR